MPQYELVIHRAADREYQRLTDDQRNSLKDTLEDIARVEQPTSHEKVEHLKGHDGFFRVRVGDVRAICRLESPQLRIYRVGYRSEVYDIVDDIEERVEA